MRFKQLSLVEKMTRFFIAVAFFIILEPCQAQFRVFPYLLEPSSNGIRINWFTEATEPGTLLVIAQGRRDTLLEESIPQEMPQLFYSELEESERAEFPDMFKNQNAKHSIKLEGLHPDTRYYYIVKQGTEQFFGHFKTAPPIGHRNPIRFITFADSETDPAGRSIYRKWVPGSQHPKSTGRPDSIRTYSLTETEGFKANLKAIQDYEPDFLILSGDIVQGGGYQRAWDEFFFHVAGKFDQPLSHIPLIPAIGNWENYGARNGGYAPEAIAASRAKYQAYFDAPPNNNPNYQNYYYRIDYGPITILTLDSSNGLPDSTDYDTNININSSTYPGDDLPDINEGSDQWNWTKQQLEIADSMGQILFVQFHHIPYSSGGHSLPLTAEKSTGQAGIPMRAYQPLFKEYGVTAVFCGHNESLEHSIVDGIHYWDVGIAGDGLGFSIDDLDPRRTNPFRQFVAHRDAPELWKDLQLIDGGKHYGHIRVELIPTANGFDLTMTPYYIFPVTDTNGKMIRTEIRAYPYAVKTTIQP